jgi:gliding motility-associated-like protein
MHRILLVLLITAQAICATAQMHIKKANFTSFRKDPKQSTEVLATESSANAKQHPEYGVTPYNAQCTQCVELLDQRTIDSRQFIDVYDNGHLYSQKSIFPLHYKKSANDIWRTIDQRLRPTAPGVYEANNQPAPTKCDLNNKSTSIKVRDFEFEFNKNLSMYFFDDATLYTRNELGNYTAYTVGEEGLRVSNIWPGMDMEQLFSAGQIKTSFVISSPLQIPISSGYMVIEDHFTLPEGYNFVESELGHHIENGKYYQGDYLIKNSKGETVVTYEKPIYIDAKAWGMHGAYKLLRNGNSYTLQTLVPVNWLTKPDNTYPLVIDPIVYGATKNGDFVNTGLPSASMGFTTMSLGACPYQMNVFIQGKSRIVNTYVDVEYSLTYDNMCGTPPLPAPFCTFSQVTMEVKSDECNTTTGQLSCNPANPPYTGTCTTDSSLVPGANAIQFAGLLPNSCIPPQCPDYTLHFTLLNRDSTCGDVCGYLCARGNMWRTTVEACRVEGNITQDKTQVCAGQPVTFTAHPNCGVPPYHYTWLYANGDSSITIYGSPNFVVYPEVTQGVQCTIIDTCGVIAQTNALDITVISAPPAEAGSTLPLCEGGSAQLGGSPTTSPGTSVVWAGENPTVTSWLNSTTATNPVALVPAGTIDTVYYVVKASNVSCFRTDTVLVYSVANPAPVIDTNGSTAVCSNQNVNIATVGSYASYLWNNGSTGSSINVSAPGPYFVTVTDNNGCTGTSNTITISSIAVPTVNVFPDTLIMYGDSVMLTTDLNLNSSIIDSFMWAPAINISCTSCTNPVVAPVSDQYYSVIVHASGCTVSDSALIRILLPNNFFIPNAFTPNGDGNNDNFFIQSQSGVSVISFQVFNRLGEKVYDNLVPWDGTYKGKPAPAGVYVYIYKLALFGEDIALLRKGSVTLIR